MTFSRISIVRPKISDIYLQNSQHFLNSYTVSWLCEIGNFHLLFSCGQINADSILVNNNEFIQFPISLCFMLWSHELRLSQQNNQFSLLQNQLDWFRILLLSNIPHPFYLIYLSLIPYNNISVVSCLHLITLNCVISNCTSTRNFPSKLIHWYSWNGLNFEYCCVLVSGIYVTAFTLFSSYQGHSDSYETRRRKFSNVMSF